MSSPIYLIGARCCGKSTIGKILSQALGYAFVDTDYYLQLTTNRSVADIVATEGWDSFRVRESIALREVTAMSTVIATGGGVILSEENHYFMRNNGQVIWLKVPSIILIDRLKRQPKMVQRPTLTGLPLTEEIGRILCERAHLYHKAAHYEINAIQSPDKVVKQIIRTIF